MMRAIIAGMGKRMSFMGLTQKWVRLLLCARINVSKPCKRDLNGADNCEDVSLVAGIDEYELLGRFFDGFAVGRPRSDQFDLEDIVNKGLKI